SHQLRSETWRAAASPARDRPAVRASGCRRPFRYGARGHGDASSRGVSSLAGGRRPASTAAIPETASEGAGRLHLERSSRNAQTVANLSRDDSREAVVEAIAQIPQAMETPAIRTILARSRNAGVLLE